MNYVEADLPPEMTLVEWRRARHAAAGDRRGTRFLLRRRRA